MPKPQKHVFVCTQNRPPGHQRGSCYEKNCVAVMEEFLQQLHQRNLAETIAITNTGCLGPCSFGTSVLIYPDSVMYGKVTKEDVTEIYEKHLVNDEIVERLKVPEFVWG
jgi:(2Fe-2S) ferredoxin